MPRVSPSFPTSRRCGGRSAACALCSAVALFTNRFRVDALRTDRRMSSRGRVLGRCCYLRLPRYGANLADSAHDSPAYCRRLEIVRAQKSCTCARDSFSPLPCTGEFFVRCCQGSRGGVWRVGGGAGCTAHAWAHVQSFSFSQEKYERRGFIIAVPGNPFFLSECTSSFTRRCALV